MSAADRRPRSVFPSQRENRAPYNEHANNTSARLLLSVLIRSGHAFAVSLGAPSHRGPPSRLGGATAGSVVIVMWVTDEGGYS